jgi:hypothetical protein
MDDNGQGDLFKGHRDRRDVNGIPPRVVFLFEKLTLELSRRGFEHYSARAVMHRIRWHYEVDKGERDFTCNNNWTPRMSRWFMDKHPELGEFFETRASPSKHDMTDYTGPYEKYTPPE